MQELIFIGFIFLGIFLLVLIYVIIEKIKEIKFNASEVLRLNNLLEEYRAKEKELIEKDEKLVKRNEELQKMYDAMLNNTNIINIFRIMAENNEPALTKEKLAKIWDILPYYPPDWELRKWIVKSRDDYICRKCGKNLKYEAVGHVHHLIPLSMNGTNEIKNLVYVCEDCHKILHQELKDFNFEKYGYQPIYGWEYYEYMFKTNWSLNRKAKAQLAGLTMIDSYKDNEPDTDLYYNISHWEEKLE